MVAPPWEGGDGTASNEPRRRSREARGASPKPQAEAGVTKVSR
jgi:hypothetical protein